MANLAGCGCEVGPFPVRWFCHEPHPGKEFPLSDATAATAAPASPDLQALVDDLRSIGAPAVVVEPLEKLLRQLQSAGADAQMRADAERVLGAFAGVP